MRLLSLSVALRLQSVWYSHALGLAIIHFEHWHRFLICQCGVWATESFERLFVKAAQSMVESLVFGMCSRNEGHSTSRKDIKIMPWYIWLLGLRIEPDVSVSDMDCVTFDIQLLLFMGYLHITEYSRGYRWTVKMNPLVIRVGSGCHVLPSCRLLAISELSE